MEPQRPERHEWARPCEVPLRRSPTCPIQPSKADGASPLRPADRSASNCLVTAKASRRGRRLQQHRCQCRCSVQQATPCNDPTATSRLSYAPNVQRGRRSSSRTIFAQRKPIEDERWARSASSLPLEGKTMDDLIVLPTALIVGRCLPPS